MTLPQPGNVTIQFGQQQRSGPPPKHFFGDRSDLLILKRGAFGFRAFPLMAGQQIGRLQRVLDEALS